MKIELKKITYNARLSDETACFSADVWIDGVKRGTVSNHGTGGPDEVHPRALADEIDAYAKTLPMREAYGHTFAQTHETIFGQLLDRYLMAKQLKRWMARSTVFVQDQKLWKGSPKPGTEARVLNVMPFEEAVELALTTH